MQLNYFELLTVIAFSDKFELRFLCRLCFGKEAFEFDQMCRIHAEGRAFILAILVILIQISFSQNTTASDVCHPSDFERVSSACDGL